MRAYHFLRDDFRSGAGDEAPWVVGEERVIDGEITLCQRGYHSSPSWYDALGYAPGSVACIVDCPRPTAKNRDATKQVTKGRKLLAARNVERELRLWGCDCAKRALLAEREAGREPDPRSWAAIAVARRYAAGEATGEELSASYSAADRAAYSASYSAAYSAADRAERDWQRRHLDNVLAEVFAVEATP